MSNGIKCGSCKGHHESVPQVRECHRSTARHAVGRRVAGSDVAVGDGREVSRQAGPAAGVAVPDGFYTAVFGNDHRTIRLRTQPKDASFAPGEQLAAFLSGQDNESDYTQFAFVKPDGRVFVWKRFKENNRVREALDVVLGNVEETGQRYALESGRCRRCNRTLTVPASINRGFGPDCAQMVGVA